MRAKRNLRNCITLLLALIFIAGILNPLQRVFAADDQDLGEPDTAVAAPDAGDENEVAANDEIEVDVVLHTVTYLVDGEEYKIDMVEHATLADLSAPEVTQSAPFLGWYIEGERTPFADNRLVTGDVVLEAKFSTDHLVTFLDANGMVLDVLEVAHNAAATKTEKIPNAGYSQAFSHWALEGTTESYGFDVPVTESIRLVPVFSGKSLAVFITQGSEVEPQAGGAGFIASPPAAPTRKGYTFAGWYGDKACTEPFNFLEPIIGTTFIYARWTPAAASYTLVLWVENPNVEAKDPADAANRGDYSAVYSVSMIGTTEKSTTLTSAELAAQWPASGDVFTTLTYSTFRFCETKTIAATGTTIINAYYTRTRFTFNFDVRYQLSGGSGTKQGNAIDAEIFLRDGTSKGKQYTLVATYGQDVTATWPYSVVVKNTYFANWGGYYGNGMAVVNDSAIAVAFSAATQLSPFDYTIRTPKFLSVTLYPSLVATPYFETRYYYIEIDYEEYVALQQEGIVEVREWSTSHATYGGKRYYKLDSLGLQNAQTALPSNACKGWPGKEIIGYETIGSNAVTAKNLCKTDMFQECKLISGRSYRINYFMPKKLYTLTLVMSSGTVQNYQSQGLKVSGGNYAASIYYGGSIDNYLPADSQVSRTGSYRFLGWYTDEACKTPYTAGTTMPFGNVMLYAKYEGTDIQVIYNDGTKDICTNGYVSETVLVEHDLRGTDFENVVVGTYVAGKGTFLGWYYEFGTVNKVETEFPLGLELTRETYVLTAKYSEQKYVVTFMLDAADGNYSVYQRQMVSSAADTLAKSGHRPLYPTLSGYTFLGWSTVAGASRVNFNTATEIADDITVYPVWRQNNYTLSFDMNGADSAPAATIGNLHYLDTLAAHKPANPTRNGYTFLYWTLNGTQMDWDAASMPSQNITLVAEWSAIVAPPVVDATHVLSFQLNGASGAAPAPQSLKEGSLATAVADPAYKGHTFLGWNTSADGSGMYWDFAASRMPKYSVVLYAQWKSEETDPIVPGTTDPDDEPEGEDPDDEPKEDTPDDEPVDDVLGFSLGGNTVPLFGKNGESWALLNLILCACGAVVAVFTLISALKRKRDGNKLQKDLAEQEGARKRIIMKVLSIILAAASIAVFVLTEDMSRQIAMLDRWTLLMGVLLAGELVLACMGRNRNSRGNKNIPNREGTFSYAAR